MVSRILFFQISAILAIASSSWAQQSDHGRSATAAQFFDDGAFRERQTAEAKVLHEKGRLISGGELAKQLGRKSYKLALPKEDHSDTSLSLSELYLKCNQSVFSIAEVRDCEGCGKLHVTPLATAFAITAKGVLLTNRHVIESIGPTSRLVASTADGTTYPVVEVLATSKKDDAAVIRVDGSGFEPLRLSAANRVGTRVAVVSHPRNAPYYLSEGIVSRLSIHASARMMFISGDFAVGSSGAPVLDYSGNVLGMVVLTSNLNDQMIFRGCTPTQSLRELFNDSDTQSALASPDPSATERACLKATFAAMQRLLGQQGTISPEKINERLAVLHSSMMHAIEVCPDDPIAKRYSDFMKSQRKRQLEQPRDETNR